MPYTGHYLFCFSCQGNRKWYQLQKNTSCWFSSEDPVSSLSCFPFSPGHTHHWPPLSFFSRIRTSLGMRSPGHSLWPSFLDGDRPTTVGCSNITSYQTQQYCYLWVLTEVRSVVFLLAPVAHPATLFPQSCLPCFPNPSQKSSSLPQHQSCWPDHVASSFFSTHPPQELYDVQYTAQKILVASYVSCLLFWLYVFTFSFLWFI